MAQAAFQTATQDSDIRIYVSCLAAYNNGILHGRWINADQDAEEYAIHDYEGFEGVSLSEYHGIDEIAALATFIAEHGELGAELFKHYGDIDTTETALEDDYCGEYRSLAEYAEQLPEETTQIPESLRYYIDYDAMARDMALGDVLVIETRVECVHVFWSR